MNPIASRAVTVLALASLYVVAPERMAIAAAHRAERAASTDDALTRQLRARITRARSVRADPATWTAAVRSALAALPPTVDVPGELADLRAVAARSGVALLSISATPPTPSPSPAAPPPARPVVAPVPAPEPEAVALTVVVAGPIQSLEAFLAALRASPRLITVGHQSISWPTGDGGSAGSSGAGGAGSAPVATLRLDASVWYLPLTGSGA